MGVDISLKLINAVFITVFIYIKCEIEIQETI